MRGVCEVCERCERGEVCEVVVLTHILLLPALILVSPEEIECYNCACTVYRTTK